jgi:hypothetical protein
MIPASGGCAPGKGIEAHAVRGGGRLGDRERSISLGKELEKIVDSSKGRLRRLWLEFRPWLGNVHDGGAGDPGILGADDPRTKQEKKRKDAKTRRELLCAFAHPRL